MPAPARMTYHTCVPKFSWVTLPAHSSKPTAASTQPTTTGRLAPRRSSMRPPTWEATTKPRKKYRRYEAGLRGRLAQCDLGVLAGEEEHGDEHEHGDAQDEVLDQEGPDPEDAHLDQRRRRCAARRSRRPPGGPRRRDAPARARDCSSPRSPTAGSRTRSGRRRGRSGPDPGSPWGRAGARCRASRWRSARGRRWRRGCSPRRWPATSTAVRKPPRIGPIEVRPPAMPKNSASALPRSRSAKVCTTMASAAGNMMAPPAPWTTRKVTIQASATLALRGQTAHGRRRRRRR